MEPQYVSSIPILRSSHRRQAIPRPQNTSASRGICKSIFNCVTSHVLPRNQMLNRFFPTHPANRRGSLTYSFLARLVENPVEGDFIVCVVKRLEILSAFKSHAEIMREFAPYPPGRLPHRIEIVAKRDVLAHVKSFLQTHSAERRNWHNLMHQPVVPHHPGDHDQAHTNQKNRHSIRRRKALPYPHCSEHRVQQKQNRKQILGCCEPERLRRALGRQEDTATDRLSPLPNIARAKTRTRQR